MKLNRNALCPCGSGKKYKKCCIGASFCDQNIITLDTCVCRYLINDAESPWYDDFRAMHEYGIQICLSDICFVELLNQYRSGGISTDEWILMIKKLKAIISRDFPILPGKKQLFQLIGTKDKEQGSVDHLDVGFEMAYSKAMFSMMEKIHKCGDEIKGCFIYNTEMHKIELSDITTKISSALQEERNIWISKIKEFSNSFTEPEENVVLYIKNEQDEVFENSIPISHRMDLLIKYVVEIIYMASTGKTPYNPCSRRNQNDGIDFVALFSIVLPSRFCTSDHIRNRLQTLDSFQKNWILTPDNVVNLFRSKKLYKLNWGYPNVD